MDSVGPPTTIQRYNGDGRGSQSIVDDSAPFPLELVVDRQQNLLVYATFSGAIWIRPLDGRPVWQLHPERQQKIDVLAMGKTYLYLGSRILIQRQLLEPGSISEPLLEADARRGLAVDPASGWMYWIEGHTIRRAKLDGDNPHTIIDELGDAYRLAIDPVGQRLYWYERADGTIWSGTITGHDVKTLVDAQLDLTSLDIDPGRRLMYWTGMDDGSLLQLNHLQRANLDGSGTERLRTSESQFYDIALDTRECGGNGTRIGATCACDVGWTGTNCECPPDTCAPGRECFGEACACLPQFDGEDCEYYSFDCQLRQPWDGFEQGAGLRIAGAAMYGGIGFDIDAAGDVNGDGYPDLIIGTGTRLRCLSGPGIAPGEAYVLFGNPMLSDLTELNVAELDGTIGFTITGAGGSTRHGLAVAGIGDLNGDGLDDLAVGNAESDEPNGLLFGRTYVLFGDSTIGEDGAIDLGAKDGGADVVFEGRYSGRSLAAAGDVNADGIDDFLIGAPSVDDGAPDPQQAAYLVFGGRGSWPPVAYLANLTGSDGDNGQRGVRLEGAIDVDHSSINAYSSLTVAGVGDIDDDGTADIAVGDPYRNFEPDGDYRDGAVYVVRGHANPWPPKLSLSELDGLEGFVVTTGAGRTGHALAPAGDANGDGVADLLISAPFQPHGSAFLLFGHSDVGQDGVVYLSPWLPQGAMRLNHWSPSNAGWDRHIGAALSGAGDVNGDGLGDIAIGTANLQTFGAHNAFCTRFNEAYILYGNTSFARTQELAVNAESGGPEGFAVVRENPTDRSELSRRVVGAGDLNGDGYDDVAIGMPASEPAGDVIVVFGGPAPADDCNGNGMADSCDIGSGTSLDGNGDGVPDECLPYVTTSVPPDGAIDARDPGHREPIGWDGADLTFSDPLDAATVTDFTVTTTAAKPLAVDRITIDGRTVTVQYDRPITPGECTTLIHLPSASRIELGTLPADVDGNGVSNPQDILTLVDHLNAVITPPLFPHQCDLDRSGTCAPADILRLIDLLNGTNTHRAWNNATLPPCHDE